MRRLPVLAVIREAYGFLFAHLGAVIAAIWLPMALVTVIGFFVEQRLFGALETASALHGVPEGAVLLIFPCYAVVAMGLYAAMTVAVARLAQGVAPAGRFPVSFGLAEWRLFRAWFGLLLFLLVPLLAFLLGAGALMPTDPAAMAGPQMSRLALLVVVMTGGLVFIGLRFTFLLPGLTAAEAAAERGLLPRAWLLSAGNFWRIFAVAAACVVPVYLCGAILEAVVQLAVAPHQPPAADFAGMIAQSRETLPLTKGFQFLLAPFVIGLMASASVFAARELNRTDISV